MSILLNSTKYCSECGSFDIIWDMVMENKSGVQEGRLRTQDVSVLYFLGCADCSETLRVVSGQKILELLNKGLMK